MAFISGADSSLISVSVVLYPLAFHHRTLTAVSWQSHSVIVLDFSHGFRIFFFKGFLYNCPAYPPVQKEAAPKILCSLSHLRCAMFASFFLGHQTCTVLVKEGWVCLWVVSSGFQDDLIALPPVEI